ncbi:MAG: hypothetical protein ACE5KV_00055, partial [Thermoplasmata archaeon]
SYYDLMSPYRDQFLNIAFLIIVISVVFTTAGVFVSERRSARIHPLDRAKIRLQRKEEARRRRELKIKMAQERRMRIQAKKHKRRIEEKKKKVS